MKKFQIILFLTILFKNILKTNVITTIGPLQLITTNGLNTFAPGNIKLYGDIYIGQSSDDIISIQGYGITNPTSGNNSLLMLNSSGNIITGNTTNSSLSCGALTATSLSTTGTLNAGSTTLGSTSTGSFIAAGTAGQTVTLGNSTGSITVAGSSIFNPSGFNANFLGITSSGTVISIGPASGYPTSIGTFTAASGVGQTVTLGNSLGGNITIAGANITNPSSGNNSLLMLNSSGNIITGNTTNSSLTCGALTASNINTAGALTAGSTTLGSTSTGSFIAAGTAGQTVTLGNSTGSITVAGSTIFNPSAFNANLLGITSTGSILSIGSASGYPVSVGSFTAAGGSGQTVTLGNSIGGPITIAGTNITKPSSGNNSLLMLNSSGNIITGNTTNSSLTCDALTSNSITTISNASISLGNTSGGNGINFVGNTGHFYVSSNIASGSNLYLTASQYIILTSSTLNKPSIGNYSPLYIDSNGAITTTSSSRTYKEKIKQLEIDNNTFDLLEPVSFNYIKDDSKQLQYGFIAEDLINIPCLQNTVIYGHDGKVESINYQAVFVALTADYIATKKALKEELKKLQNELKMKDEKLNRLENRCELLEIAINEITSKLR